MDNKLKIEYVDIKSIKMYSNNAKTHPQEQIQQIKNSILEFGFNDPIAVWKDNEIIEGHGRLLAAQELGYKELPIIRLDDLSDEQRKAYCLAHNKLTMNSDFDLDVLSAELDSITDIDMSEFDFDSFSIDEIEEVEGYDKHNDDREFFEKTLTFPIEKKQQITNYLKKHYDEVIERIMHDAEVNY